MKPWSEASGRNSEKQTGGPYILMLPGAREIRGPAEGCSSQFTSSQFTESPGNVSAILARAWILGSTFKSNPFLILTSKAAGGILKAFEEGPMTSLEARQQKQFRHLSAFFQGSATSSSAF